MSTTAPNLATSPNGWRAYYKPHDAALLLRRPTTAEREALEADIKAHGMRMPIALYRDPDCPAEELSTPSRIVLDGISRLDALEATGKTVVDDKGHLLVKHVTEQPVDPVAYVLSANLHRRHLSGEDRNELIRKVKALAPEKSTRQIAAETGFSQSSVVRSLASPEPNGSPAEALDPKVVPIRGRDGKSYSPRPASKSAEPKASSTPRRDQTIVDLVGLLHRDFARTFIDVLAVLSDERERIAALSETRRVEIAQKLLDALGLRPADLGGVS